MLPKNSILFKIEQMIEPILSKSILIYVKGDKQIFLNNQGLNQILEIGCIRNIIESK
jgi:hypothetical protein